MKHNKKIGKILVIVVSFALGAVSYAQYEDINQNNDKKIVDKKQLAIAA